MVVYIIILAVVQGLTEFLPVSSSGHLVLLNRFFGINNDFLMLSIILHLATLFSVIIVFRRKVWQIVKCPFGKAGRKLIFATIPTVIIVVLFKDFFDSAFDGRFLPFCFMITATIIVVSEILSKTSKGKKTINNKTALLMGAVQGLAVLPGISRSGSTICAGISMGSDREEVAEFSFLMSVPIIFASMALEVFEYASAGVGMTLLWYEILIGFVVAFGVGIVAIKFMLRLIKKSLIPFAIYLVCVSVLSFFAIFL